MACCLLFLLCNLIKISHHSPEEKYALDNNWARKMRKICSKLEPNPNKWTTHPSMPILDSWAGPTVVNLQHMSLGIISLEVTDTLRLFVMKHYFWNSWIIQHWTWQLETMQLLCQCCFRGTSRTKSWLKLIWKNKWEENAESMWNKLFW